MMLFSMITAAQEGHAVALMARHFGFNNFQITHIIRQFIPVFMQGLETNFANRGGIPSLLQTFDHKKFVHYYSDPEIYLNPQVRYCGLSVMEKVFGPEEAQRAVMNRVYLSTGIDVQNLKTLLPFISVLTLSSLYKKEHMTLTPGYNAAPQLTNHHGSAQPPVHVKTQPHYQARPQAQHPAQAGFARQTPPANYHAAPPKQPVHQPMVKQSAPHSLQQALNGSANKNPNFAEQYPRDPYDIHNEPLPNIIVQAQEAYAKRIRRQQFHPKHWMRSQSQFSQTHSVPPQSGQSQMTQVQPIQTQHIQAQAAPNNFAQYQTKPAQIAPQYASHPQYGQNMQMQIAQNQYSGSQYSGSQYSNVQSVHNQAAHSGTVHNQTAQAQFIARPQSQFQQQPQVQLQAMAQHAFRPAPRPIPARLEAPGERPLYGPTPVHPVHPNEPVSFHNHEPIEFHDMPGHIPFQHRKYVSLREKLSRQLPWY